MELPNLMPFQELPFNGDTFIEQEILKLKNRFRSRFAVETGTCLGSTAIFLAKNFEKVVTIEKVAKYHEIAVKRLKEHRITNAIPLQGESENTLPNILKYGGIVHDTVFFLDAHWGENCPLQAELAAIAESGIIPIIAIHDFVVPGSKELGFDSYAGQDFNFEWIKPSLDKIYKSTGYGYHYNSDEKSTAVKRGIIYVYPLVDANGTRVEFPETIRVMPDSQMSGPVDSKQQIIPDNKAWSAPPMSDGYINGANNFLLKKVGVTLYINSYTDSNPARQAELDATLAENIANPLIERIVAVVNDEGLNNLSRLSEKIVVVYKKTRPTYNDFFKLASRMITQDSEISIIANSDVFITETCVHYLKLHMKRPLCLALSHWDKMADGSYRQGKVDVGTVHEVPKRDSQDVWVFKGSIRDVPGSDFCLGKPGCDNAIADRIQKAGYVICNPSNDIRPVHHHLSGVRNYNASPGENPDRVPPPYLLLDPISIAQIPFVNDDPLPEPEKKNWLTGIAGELNKAGNSQFAEDAIIEYIFNFIGAPGRFFVDLGAGAYQGSSMSNTRTLKNKGWIGFGVDQNGSADKWVIKKFITPDNVVEILKSHSVPEGFDFLNLDIDSCDFWVLKNILHSGYRPRLICTEFNGTLEPAESKVLQYEEGYTWDGTNKYGYSFAAGKKLLDEAGYTIIFNLHNVNIFAVPTELLDGLPAEISVQRDFYHPVNPDAKWIEY